MKILEWWGDSHIPKAREAPIIKKPELPEEPETAMESEAKTPGPQLEVSPWARQGRQPGRCTAEASGTPQAAGTCSVPGSTTREHWLETKILRGPRTCEPNPPGSEPRGRQSLLRLPSHGHWQGWALTECLSGSPRQVHAVDGEDPEGLQALPLPHLGRQPWPQVAAALPGESSQC